MDGGASTTLKTGADRSACPVVFVGACSLGNLDIEVLSPGAEGTGAGADASGPDTGVGSGCPTLVHVICGWPPVNR